MLKAVNIERILFLILDRKIRFILDNVENNSKNFSSFINDVANNTKQYELENITTEIEKDKEIADIVNSIEEFIK